MLLFLSAVLIVKLDIMGKIVRHIAPKVARDHAKEILGHVNPVQKVYMDIIVREDVQSTAMVIFVIE